LLGLKRFGNDYIVCGELKMKCEDVSDVTEDSISKFACRKLSKMRKVWGQPILQPPSPEYMSEALLL